MRRTTIVTALICGSMTAAACASELTENDEAEIVYLRLCDVSACYLAWDAVDSDEDGVSDADEVVAGTNPYNAKNKPSLRVVAEIGQKTRLPSFESGRGAFLVFPEQLQSMLAEDRKDPLAAFPMRERGTSLSRAGISASSLKENGIDANRDGFTIGLDRASDSGVPARRVGGVELRLISADDDLDPLENVPTPRTVELYKDGASKTTYENGYTKTVQTDGTVVHRNEEGKVTRVFPHTYVDPEADQGSTVPTPEQKQAAERLRGAAIRTVDGWAAPTTGVVRRDPRSLIVLVDPDYAFDMALVLDSPKMTTAQPEARPDLPNPGVAADPSGFKDPCVVGCP